MTTRTALITGASAGLGLELAQLFAADKHDIVLVARRRDQLEALATRLAAERGVVARVVAADLADPGAPQRIVDELARRNIQIEYLVNNAGFGTTGPFVERDLLRELAMVQVNVASLVHLTGLLLPAMVARGSGRILNLGSTAGFQPGPFMSVYYATKAFVNSFTEALSYELRGTGVTATVSCPGATATEFGRISGNDRSRLFQTRVMGAPEVAAQAYRAMMAGTVMAIPGLRNKLLLPLLRASPRSLIRRVAARLNQPDRRLSVRRPSES
jgi:short-subunit dehydrogenase